MIEYKRGNILQEQSEALVNTVNCEGVMGRGIALQFKKIYPKNFNAYVNACKRNEVKPGKMFVFEVCVTTNPKYIINFPTKRHWRSKSKIEDINDGLKALVTTIKDYEITSIAIPPLGCGLGGLQWTVVKQHIEAFLKNLPNVKIIIYEPTDAPKTIGSVQQTVSSNIAKC